MHQPSTPDVEARRRFILEHTVLQHCPSVPEIRLHVAAEVMPVWRAFDAATGQAGGPPPYWAFAWAGGLGLARHLLDNPDIVRGRAVVDFGSGSGICAIAAMLAGAASAHALDVDPYSATAIGLNAAVNRVRVHVTEGDPLDSDPPPADVILAGDSAYEAELAARCLRWLAAARQAGAVVLIADPGRDHLPAVGLVRLATHSVRTTRELEDRDVKSVGVFTLA